jgi:hypothetical protein
MFVKAIERASGFLRPVHSVVRYYNETRVKPLAFNIIFVNEYGVAITARHVAENLEKLRDAKAQYSSFLMEKAKITGKAKVTGLRNLETKYGYRSHMIYPAVNAKLRFYDCFTEPCPGFRAVHHSRHDLSVLFFENFGKRLYRSYARFTKDSSSIRPGRSVCKLGYINPQFTNYNYDPEKDEIDFTNYIDKEPVFYPVEGIITRNLIMGYYTYGLETSTPALPGQSGGPLIDTKGLVCGINTNTASLEFMYNFKMPDEKDITDTVTINYQPKFLVGYCLHADIIKLFLKAYGIKYYTG